MSAGANQAVPTGSAPRPRPSHPAFAAASSSAPSQPTADAPAPNCPHTSDQAAAQRAWLALVYSGLLGERGAIRISHDAGAHYYPSHERRLGQPPSRPAASYLCTNAGTGRLVVCDFDAKPASSRAPWQAASDATAARLLLERLGGRVIEDYSPSGGRHLYIPLSRAVPHTELARLARALEARMSGPGWHRTYDKSPMMSRDGLIRLPGSPHPLGGYQALITPLAEAARIARHGNAPDVLTALTAELAVELAALDIPAPDAAPASAGFRPLPPYFEAIARTGTYDLLRYRSGSEARLAVLRVARLCGWQLDQIIDRSRPGRMWQGLGRFYDRYSHTVRRRQWERDWTVTGRTAPSGKDGYKHRRNFLTSLESTPPRPSMGQPKHAGPALPANGPDQIVEWGFIRTAVTALHEAEASGRWDDRGGLSVRLVLRAAAYAAAASGSRRIEFGTRFLALFSCLDRSTVAAALRRLRSEPDPFLVQVRDAHGIGADRYEWRIPAAYAELAASRGPVAGRLDPIHPIFRALGPAAAIAHAALGPTEAMSGELARTTRLSPEGQRTALRTLAEMGLAERGPRGWRRIPADLDELARALGADEAHDAVAERYALERATWQAMCAEQPAVNPPSTCVPAAAATVHDAGPATRPEATAPDPPPPELNDEPEPQPADDTTSTPTPAATDPGIAQKAGRTPGRAADRDRRTFLELPALQRAILAELFDADHAAERAERTWEASGERARPAATWRALTAAAPVPGPLAKALAHLADLVTLTQVLDELEAEQLVTLQREQALFTARITVWLTRRARRITRAGLGLASPPKPPPGMVSAGLWRCLEQVAAAGVDGVPEHTLWDRAGVHLGEGTRMRPGRGFITLSGDRWFLTEAGQQHFEGFTPDYQRLYPSSRASSRTTTPRAQRRLGSSRDPS